MFVDTEWVGVDLLIDIHTLILSQVRILGYLQSMVQFEFQEPIFFFLFILLFYYFFSNGSLVGYWY